MRRRIGRSSTPRVLPVLLWLSNRQTRFRPIPTAATHRPLPHVLHTQAGPISYLSITTTTSGVTATNTIHRPQRRAGLLRILTEYIRTLKKIIFGHRK